MDYVFMWNALYAFVLDAVCEGYENEYDLEPNSVCKKLSVFMACIRLRLS